MAKILVINGPNLDLLGTREPTVYGTLTLEEIKKQMEQAAIAQQVELSFFQSNHEGAIVDAIGRAAGQYQAIIINPAAYTHTSVAIRDAIAATGLPAVEVHISNIYGREEFRHKSLIAAVCSGQISGFGIDSYLLAVQAAARLVGRSA
jgi:3-dehydroquinate dehydratase-2